MEASRLTPYSANYLGLLVRKKKLSAKKVSGRWMTTPADIENYLEHFSLRSEGRDGSSFSRQIVGSVGTVFYTLTAAFLLFFSVGVFLSTSSEAMPIAEKGNKGGEQIEISRKLPVPGGVKHQSTFFSTEGSEVKAKLVKRKDQK